MTTQKRRCARCGKRFKKGGPAYRIKAELISHFDGYIRGSNKGLKELVGEIETLTENMTAEELEKQIYQKFEYIVCPSCRDEIEKFLSLSAEEENR
jgi:DNA-directed RNA polymerase subunit RPC12/RpoP